jgi:hypothetical protein
MPTAYMQKNSRLRPNLVLKGIQGARTMFRIRPGHLYAGCSRIYGIYNLEHRSFRIGIALNVGLSQHRPITRHIAQVLKIQTFRNEY